MTTLEVLTLLILLVDFAGLLLNFRNKNNRPKFHRAAVIF